MSYSIKVLSFLFLLLFSLFANADDLVFMPGLYVDKYNRADCCTFIDKLESVKLERGKSLDIDLSDTNNLLELSTGPTFSALIEIPIWDDEQEFKVRTDVIEHEEELYAFFPYVAVLDKDMNLLGSTAFSRLNYVGKAFLIPTAHLWFNFEVENNKGEHKTTRYLLIYTKAKHFSNKDIDSLRDNSANIELKEVPSQLNDSLAGGPHVEVHTIYGLPASKVKITSKVGLF